MICGWLKGFHPMAKTKRTPQEDRDPSLPDSHWEIKRPRRGVPGWARDPVANAKHRPTAYHSMKKVKKKGKEKEKEKGTPEKKKEKEKETEKQKEEDCWNWDPEGPKEKFLIDTPAGVLMPEPELFLNSSQSLASSSNSGSSRSPCFAAASQDSDTKDKLHVTSDQGVPFVKASPEKGIPFFGGSPFSGDPQIQGILFSKGSSFSRGPFRHPLASKVYSKTPIQSWPQGPPPRGRNHKHFKQGNQ